jgi:hypothetical protein
MCQLSVFPEPELKKLCIGPKVIQLHLLKTLGATIQENLKTNTKTMISSKWTPPGTPRVSKDVLLSTKQAHGSLVHKY